MIKKTNNNSNNNKFSRKDMTRGRQRGKQEALPLHHGTWQSSSQIQYSNTV